MTGMVRQGRTGQGRAGLGRAKEQGLPYDPWVQDTSWNEEAILQAVRTMSVQQQAYQQRLQSPLADLGKGFMASGNMQTKCMLSTSDRKDAMTVSWSPRLRKPPSRYAGLSATVPAQASKLQCT